eukprot:Pgem_evm1s11274
MTAAVVDQNSTYKLFVGQIPKTFTEDDLVKVFAEHGEVVEKTILKGKDGKQKGCAFVTYQNKAQAEAAINALHEKTTLP